MPKSVIPSWSTLLHEMRATGMTQAEIAQAVSLSQASVSDLLNGKVKTTEYSIGVRIIAAHKAAMRRKARTAAAAT